MERCRCRHSASVHPVNADTSKFNSKITIVGSIAIYEHGNPASTTSAANSSKVRKIFAISHETLVRASTCLPLCYPIKDSCHLFSYYCSSRSFSCHRYSHLFSYYCFLASRSVVNLVRNTAAKERNHFIMHLVVGTTISVWWNRWNEVPWIDSSFKQI